MRIRKYHLSIFLILLLLSTYLSLGEEFVLVVFVISITFMYKGKIAIPKGSFKIFIYYYAVVTTAGLLMGKLNIKSFIEFFLRYMCTPFIVFALIPDKFQERIDTLRSIRSFIGISAIYGTIEYSLHYNPIVKILKISAKRWLEAMNISDIYQPSSFFLHYNFYACMLLSGIIITIVFPYKKRTLNILFYSLIITQLLLVQSRICWIAGTILLFYHVLSRKHLSIKHVSRMTMIIISFFVFILIKPVVLIKLINAIKIRFAPIFKYGFEYGSLGQRVGTLMNWPKYAIDSPIKGLFGTGFNSSSLYLKNFSYFQGYSTADCQWTTYLVECGLLGTIILIAAMLHFMKMNKRNSLFYLSKLGLLTYFILSFTFDVVGTSFVFIPLIVYIGVSVKREINEIDKCEVYRVESSNYETGRQTP